MVNATFLREDLNRFGLGQAAAYATNSARSASNSAAFIRSRSAARPAANRLMSSAPHACRFAVSRLTPHNHTRSQCQIRSLGERHSHNARSQRRARLCDHARLAEASRGTRSTCTTSPSFVRKGVCMRVDFARSEAISPPEGAQLRLFVPHNGWYARILAVYGHILTARSQKGPYGAGYAPAR